MCAGISIKLEIYGNCLLGEITKLKKPLHNKSQKFKSLKLKFVVNATLGLPICISVYFGGAAELG